MGIEDFPKKEIDPSEVKKREDIAEIIDALGNNRVLVGRLGPGHIKQIKDILNQAVSRRR